MMIRSRSILHFLRPRERRHSRATILLHWGTVGLVVFGAILIYVRDPIEDRPLRQALLDLHRQIGLLVLLALALRLAVRGLFGIVDHLRTMPVPLRWAARVSHMSLYALLLALPLLGLAASQAHGVKVLLLGALPLPGLAEADSDLADVLDEYHIWAGWAMAALVGAHALAALWHHFVRRDAVLGSMLPLRDGREQSSEAAGAGAAAAPIARRPDAQSHHGAQPESM